MKAIRSQTGFSLIELMVVVAIIGILAAIAVPNFKNFQAKARQSEAQTNLGAVFTAEQAFYAEWSGYYGDLPSIGYAPMPSSQPRYEIGFKTNGAAPSNFVAPAAGVLLTTSAQATAGAPVFTPCWVSSPCAASPNTDLVAGASITSATAFTAEADSTNIGGSGALDTWTITNANVIAQTASGL